MTTKVEIKIARPEDRDIIKGMFLNLLQFLDQFDHDMLPTEKNAAHMTDKVFMPAAARGEPILIAWDQGNPVGGLFWAVNLTLPYESRWKSAYGYGTYLKEGYRSKKIGTEMREMGFKILKEKGVEKLYGTVLFKNQVSVKANDRLGAIPMSRLDVFNIK